MWQAAETLRETTDTLLRLPVADRFGVAVPYLRATARVLGAHYHLRAALADPEGAHGRLARFYITRMLPEHGALLAEVRAGDAPLMALTVADLAV